MTKHESGINVALPNRKTDCTLSDFFQGRNVSRTGRIQDTNVSRKRQYKDVYRGTIEMLQRARTFQLNCCLKIHNAHLKLLSPISG